MKIADCRLPIAGRGLLAVTAFAALALAAGCSSPQMKGTPFYTGEYERRVGPAENRINGWPILYYREPALSVLWPLGELTDDYFAIRPVLSVYGLGTDKKEYNVLWPLAQFNQRTGDNRLIPAFWGRDYACVFPLYWHGGSPYAGKPGYDTLLPLWWFSRDPGGYSTWLLGPLAHFTEHRDRSGWHVFPLAGRYSDGGDLYRFVAWPLFHQWSEDRGAGGGSALIPLYGYNRGPGDSWFLSLPYSSWREPDGDSWRMITPLYFDGASDRGSNSWRLAAPFYYSSRTPDSTARQSLLGGYRRHDDKLSWWALPLLAGGQAAGDSGSFWLLGPLAHSAWDARSRSHHVAPLYYRSQSDEGSRFLSLPWSSSVDKAGNGWHLAPPLYYGRRTADGESLITPLYAQGQTADGKSGWQALIPIYYRQQAEDEKLLATLLGGYRTDAEGDRWLIYPLLSGGSRDERGRSLWLAAPLFHWQTRDNIASHHLLPLYYWGGEERTLISPLAAHWTTARGGNAFLVPPALTYWSDDPKRWDLWTAAGLLHLSGGEERGPQHLAPLFYRNPRTGTFLSPAYAGWRKGGKDYGVCPPLLSMYSSDGRVHEIDGLLGLLNEQWGGREREGHLIPLYLYRGSKEVYTPLFGWNQRNDGSFYYPLTPLLGVRTGERYSGGWLFPLVSHRRDRRTDDIDGTFLWGGYDTHGARSRVAWWPFFGYRNHGPMTAMPTGEVRYAKSGKEFWSLPACWYENTVELRPEYGRALPIKTDGGSAKTSLSVKASPAVAHVRKNGFFPLWSYKRSEESDRNTLDVDASCLLLLYDYLHEIKPDSGPSGQRSDYTRSRILWRLWHYERSNGDVSVDIIPAITYDHKADGYRQVSFLWRFLRYEHSRESLNVDLLFIPVWRGKG